MTLWEHQRQALDLIYRKSIATTGKTLVVMPPGAGKSEIACQSVLAWLRLSCSHRAIICVPNRRLISQFFRRLAMMTREPIGFEQGVRRPNSATRIVIASQLSLIDRLTHYSVPADTLVIVDEAHHSSYDAPEFQRVISKFGRSIGLSATPWTNGLNSLFPNVYFYSLTNAISDNVISPFEVRKIDQLAPSQEHHTLVFVARNKDAREKSSRFPNADWIGHTRDESTNLLTLDRWRSRKISLLFANRMLLEGYDTPETSTVWIDHSLDSLVMCAQILGRALRYKPQKKAVLYVIKPDTLATVNAAIQLMETGPK